MDQADGIIIPILRNIGCDIDPKVTSISEFTASTLVGSVSQCLMIIDSTKYKNLPKVVPKSKTKQFRLGSQLSNAIKELGYRREVGYETFLYPNETDTRNLVRWLVSEKLPQNKGNKRMKRKKFKTGATTTDDEETDIDDGGILGEEDEDETDMFQSNLTGRALLEKNIHDNLKTWINTKYSILRPTQNITQFRTNCIDFPNQSQQDVNWKGTINYYSDNCDYIFNQTEPTLTNDWFLPSLLANNHKHYLIEQIENGTEFDSNDTSSNTLDGNESDWQIQNLLKTLNVRSLISESISSEIKSAESQLNNSFKSNKASQSQSQIIDNTKWQRELMYKTDDTNKNALMVDEQGQKKRVTMGGTVEEELSEEDQELARAKELTMLETKLNNLKERVSKMKSELDKLEETQVSKENEIKENESKTEQLLTEKRTKEKTLALLPNAEENLVKLKQIVEKSERRLKNAHIAWENEEIKYKESLESERKLIESKQLTTQEMKNEIKQIRQNMRQCASDIREKEELLDRLIDKLNQLPKTIDRQVYVDRILGVVVNLENQNEQIKSILNDVNSLQRETNKISETSKRTFGVTDDIVFKAAQNAKDAMSKKQLNKVYRYIVDMRELFDKIVETVRKISNTQNEIRDLEYQIIALQEKSESLEMKKIKKDVKEVETENEQLAEQLKKLKKMKKAKKQAMS